MYYLSNVHVYPSGIKVLIACATIYSAQKLVSFTSHDVFCRFADQSPTKVLYFDYVFVPKLADEL